VLTPKFAGFRQNGGYIMTLKKALLRGLLGAPLGVFIGYTITILISMYLKDGGYSPVVPQLMETMGNEINAIVLQYLLSALLGFASAFGSAVFEIEEWSITKQTMIHFLLLSVSMFPVAYFTYWMRHTLWGILSYVGIFIALYAVIWAIQIYFWKKRIEGINRKLQGK
jgi:hypothetical protein